MKTKKVPQRKPNKLLTGKELMNKAVFGATEAPKTPSALDEFINSNKPKK